MFAYCLNNPVCFYDDGGTKPKSYDETVDALDDDGIFPDNCDNTGAPQQYNSWQEAEHGTRDALDSVQKAKERTFDTANGERIVDAYNPSTKVIAESKYGYQGRSSFIASEIERDAWLLERGIVQRVEWHFYYSLRSNSIGYSGPLYVALDDANIVIVLHD